MRQRSSEKNEGESWNERIKKIKRDKGRGREREKNTEIGGIEERERKNVRLTAIGIKH